MPSTDSRAHRVGATIFSLACHGALITLLLAGATHATRSKPQPSTLCCVAALEVTGGSRAPRMPLPEAPAAAHASKIPPPELLTRPPIQPHERRPAKASGTNAAAAKPRDLGTNTLAGNGDDARNASPAFPTYSPNPAVHDRALLPNSEQQVVVDVKLSAAGEVIGENLVKGIGNALDGIVMDMVKTWRYQPAKIDGKPVPSEAEVIVSFSQRYPITA